MVEAKAIANDFDALAENLAIVPTSTQIKKVYPSYDPSYQYVLWYVSKKESDGWHIDGVLLDKTMYNVTYTPNFDEWKLNTASLSTPIQFIISSMFAIAVVNAQSLVLTFNFLLICFVLVTIASITGPLSSPRR